MADSPVARFTRSAGAESTSNSAADFSSGGGAGAQAAGAAGATTRGTTARGALHCLWPRYESRFGSAAQFQAAERRQLPPAVAALAGWFSDGPLHIDVSADGAHQPQPQPQGLAGMWRYQGFRL